MNAGELGQNFKGSNSFSINLSGASISNIQIQQGTTNSSQTSNLSKNFDYDAISKFLNQISKYDLSESELGENSEKIQEVIGETKKAVEAKAYPSVIKHLLHTLRDLAVGVVGSLIATGIAAQINELFARLG